MITKIMLIDPLLIHIYKTKFMTTKHQLFEYALLELAEDIKEMKHEDKNNV